MTYTLYIGNKRYSSWSMRPWVLLKALDIPFSENIHLFQTGPIQSHFLSFSPTGKVPCLHDTSHASPISVWDSLAIVEYIAEAHPQVWPESIAAKAFARCAVAEMHSGFPAIRDECSFTVALRIDLGSAAPSEPLAKDLRRFSALFEEGLERFGGPWLAGDRFTAADAFYAPIVVRLKAFGLEVEGEAARGYVERLWERSAVQDWVAAGRRETAREKVHEEDCIRGRRILQDFSQCEEA